MKIEKLEAGMTIKNYKALTEILELKTTAGKSKQLQLNELKRYCEYHKEGNKFIIDLIYDTPLPKVDNRKNGNNNIYGELVQFLILDLLVQGNNKGSVSISRNRLIKAIGMVNSNYTYYSNDIEKLVKRTETNKNVIYDIYNTTTSNFRSMIETALKNLYDKRIIIYETVFKVKELNHINVRQATELEKQTILEYERKTLESYGYTRISEIRNSIFWKPFLVDVKELLHNECDIDYYFVAYNITINEKYILDERKNLLDFLLKDLKRNEYKNELNTTVIFQLLKNAKKRHENAFQSGRKSTYRSKDTYLDDIKKLIDVLINNQGDKITYKIMSFNTKKQDQVDIEELENQIDFDSILPF